MKLLRIVVVVLALALLGAVMFFTGGRPTRTGRLAVALRDEVGAPVEEYRVFVRVAGTPEVVYEFAARDGDEEGRLPPVAVGEYDVQVVPGAADDVGHFLLDFELEGVLAVRAGEVQHIERTVETGGRLRVIATCSPVPDEGAAQLHVSWDPFETGRVWPMFFRPADGRAEASPATDLLEHDRPYLSRDVLPSGTYPVRIEHPGYDSVEMFVTLEPGRVTLVDTLLFPKLR